MRILRTLLLKDTVTGELKEYELQDEGMREKFNNFLQDYKPFEYADELKDLRVGYDDITYKTAGEAVRTQFLNMLKTLPSDLSDSRLHAEDVEKSYVIDCSTAQVHKITLTSEKCALAFKDGLKIAEDIVKDIRLYIIQGTGSNAVEFPTNVLWANGVAPILSFKKGAIDVIQLTTIDQGKTWLGNFADTWVG